MADLMVRAAGLLTIGVGVLAGFLTDGVRASTIAGGSSAAEFVLMVVCVSLISAGTFFAFCGSKLLEGSRFP
ncbi:MAG: hypothetical protein WBL20_06435 [Sphingobium sp.]|jgi:hypothetical protein